jgi:hypothetical protein
MVMIVSSVSGFILRFSLLNVIAVMDASTKDNPVAKGQPT